MRSVIYRVTAWAKHFENNRTRELKYLDWVPVPNRMDGDGYTELLDHPEGASHFGAWISIVEVASRCDPRGTLLRDGAKPHDSASLSRLTRIPRSIFDAALPRLVHIGWLSVEVVDSSTDTTIPHEGAGKSQEGDAALRKSAYGTERNGTEERDDDDAREANGKVTPGPGRVDVTGDDLPGPPAEAAADGEPSGDALDAEIRRYFAGHPRLMWSPAAHGKVRKLVLAAKWPTAKECIEVACRECAADPPAYALTVWGNRQAKHKIRREAVGATPKGEWEKKRYCPG